MTIDLKSDYRIYKLSEIKGINIRPLAPHWESELNGRTTEKPFLAYEITIKVNLKDHYKCQVLNDGECEKGNLNYLHGLFNDFKYLTESGIKLWDENGGQSMFG